MQGVDWREEALAAHHDCTLFTCRETALTEFLQRHALVNQGRFSTTYVAVTAAEPLRVLGYYSLCAASVEFDKFPRKAKSYPMPKTPVPVTRLARLARCTSTDGTDLGRWLLVRALKRAVSASDEVASCAVLIDAKNPKVATWYESFGAIRFKDEPLKLVFPFEQVKEWLVKKE